MSRHTLCSLYAVEYSGAHCHTQTLHEISGVPGQAIKPSELCMLFRVGGRWAQSRIRGNGRDAVARTPGGSGEGNGVAPSNALWRGGWAATASVQTCVETRAGWSTVQQDHSQTESLTFIGRRSTNRWFFSFWYAFLKTRPFILQSKMLRSNMPGSNDILDLICGFQSTGAEGYPMHR